MMSSVILRYITAAVVFNLVYLIIESHLFIGCLGKVKTKTEVITGYAILGCKSNFTARDITSLWYFGNDTITEPLYHQLKEVSEQNGRYTSKLSEDGTSTWLEINNVTFRDAGMYSCVLYTDSQLWKETIILQVYGQPELRASTTNTTENDTITAVCCVDVPISTIVEFSWNLDNKAFPHETNDTQTNATDYISNSCSIVFFPSDRKYHNKELICTMETVWTSMLKEITINVRYPATVQMVTSPNLSVADDTNTVLLICKVDGNPKPEVFLQKLNNMFEWKTIDIKALNMSNLTSQLWGFHLSSINNNVNGRYRCTANNVVGAMAVSGIVIVEKKVNTSIFWRDNSWIIYVMSVVVTFIAAVVITKLTHKTCLSRYTSLRTVRRDFPQTENVALPSVKITTSNSLDLYHSIDENHTAEQHQLQKFDQKVVTFVAKLSQDTKRERWLGILHKGRATETYAHMKSYTDSAIANEGWEYYLRHIAILPKNKNIVTTFGIVEKSGITYCLQDYLAFGTVRTYLEITFGQSFLYGNALEPVPQHFLTYASNVIHGIKFLHYHGWIHPGLSSEKLLIFDAGNSCFSCKLYDFCHVMSARERVKEELAKNNDKVFLNMSPEAKRNGEYTRQSDIWAVGVVLWEIFSYGAKIPEYKEIQKPKDVLGKLPRPGNCPGQMYEAMSLCWQWDQQSRLSLDELIDYLQSTTETYMATTKQKVDFSRAGGNAEGNPEIYNREIYKKYQQRHL